MREAQLRGSEAMLPRKQFIRVEPGTLGYHAIIEGGSGDWASSRVSEDEAVRECVGRHILGRAIIDADAMGGYARLDIRWIGNGLWMIESNCITGPDTWQNKVYVERQGAGVVETLVDKDQVAKPLLPRVAGKIRKLGRKLLTK